MGQCCCNGAGLIIGSRVRDPCRYSGGQSLAHYESAGVQQCAAIASPMLQCARPVGVHSESAGPRSVGGVGRGE